MEELLDRTAVQLAVKQLLFGRDVVYYESVDSTNVCAKELALAGADLPLVITAEEQTAGRGRHQRVWFSPFAQGLWVSFVFPPADETVIGGQYNFIVSLAAAQAVKTVTGLHPTFKWPNDIQIAEKKVCGILVESFTRGDGKRLFIAGAGINVNISAPEFPREIAYLATSLLEITGLPVDRTYLFIELIASVDLWYNKWLENGIDPIYTEWIKSCTTIGKQVAIRSENISVYGTAESVQSDGSLLIRDSAGAVQRVYAGDVEYIAAM